MKFLKEKNGYIWAFHRKDHSSLGIGIEFEDSKDIKEELDYFIKNYYPNVKIISKWAALIPTIKNLNTFEIPVAGKNWILIGDAAGHVDPITGEGIHYALWSAKLASKAIIKNEPQDFDKMWRREYGIQLIEGSKLKPIFYNKYALEIIVEIASKSKTCSEFLYDIVTGGIMYNKLISNFLKKTPRILLEYFNLL